jgi:S-DNA-T family DNA segregation ATPase FtsK/SpoIIIE
MTLHCTLVRGPGAGRPDPPLELTVEAPHGCGGSEVQHAIMMEFCTGNLSVGGVPLSVMTVGVAPLVNGAVLVDGAGEQPSNGNYGAAPTLLLAVHSGPGSGTVLPLKRGSYRIGRSSGTEISLPDAALSREHARLDVTETAVSITDLGSANGTIVDGKRVNQAVVSTESLISCGNSTMSILFNPAPQTPDAEWESAGSSVAEPLKIARRAENGSRLALLLTASLPLVIGVGLAIVTGMWMFLAFTAVSAFSVLVPMAAGRRQRLQLKASVAAAVHKDRERRRRAAPSAAELALRGQRNGSSSHGEPGLFREVRLRLGLAAQPANISLDPPDSDFEAPQAGRVPVTLEPSDLATICGPQQDTMGLVRSMIMQLTGYRLAAGTRILVHGPTELLPLTARCLRRVSLSSNAQTTAALLEGGPDRGCNRGLLMVIDNGDAPTGSAKLISTAIGHGWQVITCAQTAAKGSGHVVELGGSIARLVSGNSLTDFVPDLVPAGVFDRYCREMASSAGGPPLVGSGVPPTCSLADVIPLSAAETSLRWSRGKLRPGLSIPIGLTATGPRMLDLEADGPHLLVAGTTGSGKSELLRSLTSALALSYPPDRISFLFIDFKGGSGLGPLTGFPHCVGMLTDLTRHELDRSLASLRAEIRRREELLSAVQAPDLAGYRNTEAGQAAPLPHLILIIDEFRMLVEEAPGALTQLMRIATIGRSLGIHLIMATQRPQGALTADIRANVTTSIALRVQSEMESMDIINSKVAAQIAVTSPGRAYLVRGTEKPVEFQTASLAGAAAGLRHPGVRACLAEDIVRSPEERWDGRMDPPVPVTPAQAAAPIVESLVALWAAAGGAAAHRPVAMPLPSVIPCPVLTPLSATAPDDEADADVDGTCVDDDRPGDHWSVQLGWADQPDRQRISRLAWHPAEDSHLGMIGGAGGGLGEAMALTVQQLIEHDVESHIYVLDADSSFVAADSQPRVGAVAGLHELRRGVRILERIALELSLRLSRPAPQVTPPVVLVLSGWGSWVSAFRAGPLNWAEDLVQNIVRDGARAGITVVISGDREVVTARFFAAVPNRAYFPTGSSEESRLAWPRMPEVAQVPGRAVVFGAFVGSSPSVAQFYALREVPPAAGTGHCEAPLFSPFRIEPLPTRVSVSDVRARLVALDPRAASGGATAETGYLSRHRQILVGIGGDELVPVAVRLPTGSVLAVLGSPGSGKTTFIATLPELNPLVRGWVRPGPAESVERYWADVRAETATGSLPRDSILLVDDADLLAPEASLHLVELHSQGWTVILTAGFSPTLIQRVPLALAARSHSTGILIAPHSIVDGDLFGLRFEVETNPPAGRAVLISEGRATPVQLAADPAPGSECRRGAARA